MKSNNKFLSPTESVIPGVTRTKLALAMTVALGVSSPTLQANLVTGAVLNFEPGARSCTYGGVYPDCVYGTPVHDVTGSYFAMDTSGIGTISSDEKTLLTMHDGLIIGVAQPATGSHVGPPTTLEIAGVDEPWLFFTNTGMHLTTAGPTVVTDSGATKTLDFSGWGLTWAGSPDINMGGGMQDCGTTNDGICVSTAGDHSGTYDNGTGLATITCSSVSCSDTSSYTLDYAAIVPQADPSNHGGVSYFLHLEGTVSSVPVPASAWLLGSGLVALSGMARRKRGGTTA